VLKKSDIPLLIYFNEYSNKRIIYRGGDKKVLRYEYIKVLKIKKMPSYRGANVKSFKGTKLQRCKQLFNLFSIKNL
jgi:hypothetical protein